MRCFSCKSTDRRPAGQREKFYEVIAEEKEKKLGITKKPAPESDETLMLIGSKLSHKSQEVSIPTVQHVPTVIDLLVAECGSHSFMDVRDETWNKQRSNNQIKFGVRLYRNDVICMVYVGMEQWTYWPRSYRMLECSYRMPESSSSEGFGHGGPGVCLDDGETATERLRSQGGTGDALLRRMPPIPDLHWPVDTEKNSTYKLASGTSSHNLVLTVGLIENCRLYISIGFIS